MITIKRTNHNQGAKFLVYLCYVDGVLIHQQRMDNLFRYQTLDVLAPTGKDILVKERVFYSDDDYHETEKLIPYQEGNIHRDSLPDVSPIVLSKSGGRVIASRKDKLTVNTCKMHMVRKYAPGFNTIHTGSNEELELPEVDFMCDVVSWADTDYGTTGMTNMIVDPTSKVIIDDDFPIPAKAPVGEALLLDKGLGAGSRCVIGTVDGKELLTKYPSAGKVTIPGHYFKTGHKVAIAIISPANGIKSRIVQVTDDQVLDGEISKGQRAILKITNELKTLDGGDMHPLDAEFRQLTDGAVDPHNMTKLRLDGYDTYDDTIVSMEDECLYRFTGDNMVPTAFDTFTGDRLPSTTRFIHRRADGLYVVAAGTTVSVYTSTFQQLHSLGDRIRYMTGGFFFSRYFMYYVRGTSLDRLTLPPELHTYMPCYTQHGYIHFLATNDTPSDLPKHNGFSLETMSLLPLGDADSTVDLLRDRIVTHSCMGLDGDPMFVADGLIFTYDVVKKKYRRTMTISGRLVAFYRLDDYIILKTGDDRHHRLVMDT